MSNRWHELFGGIHWLMGSPVAGLTTHRADAQGAGGSQPVSESIDDALDGDSAREVLITPDQQPYAGGHGR